jgi:hypothetical protein
MLALRVLAGPNRETWPAAFEQHAGGTGFMIMKTPRPYYGPLFLDRKAGQATS